MKIGIGLPNTVYGLGAPLITSWARRAELRGFESLCTADRLAYPSLDSIVTLALARAASDELTLVTNLLGPLYPPTILAKQLATLALAAPGRLIVGLAVGLRGDDYAAAGVDFSKRGRLLDDEITTLRHAWSGAPTDDGTQLCQAPVKIPLLIGGGSKAAIRRAATVGDGWVGGSVRNYSGHSKVTQLVRAAWRDVGKIGDPQTQMSVNFAFGGAQTAELGRRHLSHYYGFLPDYAKLNVDDLITSPQDARDTVHAYRDLGFDRLLFHPTVASLEQVDRLADAVL